MTHPRNSPGILLYGLSFLFEDLFEFLLAADQGSQILGGFVADHITGKVRANSGRAGLRIDYYKDDMRKDYLGSSTSEITDSKDWKTVTVDTRDDKKGASHIAVTCICHGDAEACFDELSLLAK